MSAIKTSWVLELIDKITAPSRKATQATEEMGKQMEDTTNTVGNFGNKIEQVGEKIGDFGKGMFVFNQVADGIQKINDAFSEAIEPGIRFQESLAQVQAISGLSDDKMAEIGDKARNLAKIFGEDAAESTGLFAELLSQLGPELANTPEALDMMGRHVMTLSKTMNGDVRGAASALTSAFNAFDLSLENPINSAKEMGVQMDIIAKSAQVGAAEVPDIAASLSAVGVSAKNFGVSFAETNAILQVFAQKTIKGAEAGTALRNIMTIISAPTAAARKELEKAGVKMKVLQDKTLPLADRLQALAPAIANDTVMVKTFGRENIVAAQTLIGSIDKIKEWTAEVQGSASATEQAAVIMGSYAEKQKRMHQYVNDLKIAFFEFVEPIAPVIEILGLVVATLVTLGTTAWSVGQIMTISAIKSAGAWVVSMLSMLNSTIAASLGIQTAIYNIPIVGWVLAAIAAIGALVAYLWNKFGEVRAFFYGFWNYIKTSFTEYYKFIWEVMKAICEIINPLNWFDADFSFSEVWDKLSNAALEGGKKVADAFKEGWDEGMQEFDQEKGKTAGTSNGTSNFKLSPSQPTIASASTSGNTHAYGDNTSSGGGSSKKGGGGVKNITMNVTMNNHFAGGDGDFANKVKRQLIAIMTDVAPTAG